MCGLFGFMNYGQKLNSSDLSQICNALARESEVRGSHATGISFINKGTIYTQKAPKAAYRINYKLPSVISLLGHTRHATQGSEKKNQNNHPFVGFPNSNKAFALAHNGILYNDTTLRQKHRLPRSKIETDSYVAVQLIEQKGNLTFASLKYMAEQVRGSFSFSLLDHLGNVYIIKGDSPISMLHFEELGFYIYASTDDILWKAMANTKLLTHIQKVLESNQGGIKQITIKSGEIIKIDTKGTITYATFEYDDSSPFGCNWWDFGSKPTKDTKDKDEYITELKSVAVQLGYNSDEIDALLEGGYSCHEIEELLYDSDYTEDDNHYGELSYQICGK